MNISSDDKEEFLSTLDILELILCKVKDRSIVASMSAKEIDLHQFLISQVDNQRSTIDLAYERIDAFKKFLNGDAKQAIIEPLSAALSLGFLIGHTLKMDAFNMNEFQEIIASTIGRNNIKRRHDKRAAIKQSLVAQAEELWRNGSSLLHNEMAKELLKPYPKDGRPFAESTLREALIDVARKYNKVRGDKDARKKSCPPQ